MITREKLFSELDELGIAHNTIDHDPVFTVEESASVKGKMPGAHSKTLFLKDKAGQFFLICAKSDTSIRLNKFRKELFAGYHKSPFLNSKPHY